MFHPDFGYQINILPKFQKLQGHEVYIVTSEMKCVHPMFASFGDNENIDLKDRQYELTTGVKVLRLPIHGFISRRVLFKAGYRKIVDDLKPDILFCHFNDTIVGIWYTLLHNKLGYPIIFDSHMLEMASTNPFSRQFRFFYRKCIAPLIIKDKLKVIRTQDDDYVERCLGIPLTQCPFISFGTDTSLFHPDQNVKQKFRHEHNIADEDYVVVYTGKLDEAKGGRLLAETFREKLTNGRQKKVVLLVVGNTSGEYGREVEKIFAQSKNRVIRFPTQKYVELAKFYQAADLSVFPKQCSLSFYDAQACGLPVISEDNNINSDRLCVDNGTCFLPDDTEDFRRKIVSYIEMPDGEYERLRKNAYTFVTENYDYRQIAQNYTDIMTFEIERFNNDRGK
jgi:glycosyltransferase involved in cell wall biosynthesis